MLCVCVVYVMIMKYNNYYEWYGTCYIICMFMLLRKNMLSLILLYLPVRHSEHISILIIFKTPRLLSFH